MDPISNYLSFFSADYPPSFGGSMVLWIGATLGQLITSVLAAKWFWDSFRRFREDIGERVPPNVRGSHPVDIHRLIMCFLMAGTVMRIFPLALQNLIRPEITEASRMKLALFMNLSSGLSVVPFTIATVLFVMSRYTMEEQLKKQPFVIDYMPRWDRVKSTVWIVAICAFIVGVGALH